MTKKAREQLATHLGAQSHERLVELVTELAEGDVELRNRLLLEAASAGTGPVDAASYRRSFSDALRSGSAARRDGPRTSGAWARGVHQVTESIGALLAAGHAEEVIGITEYALGRVDVTMSRVDDSSGWFSQVLMDLEALHHAACEAVRPDPVALARRLFAMEVDTEWDILIDSAQRYADLLGDDGLAEMRRLAEERWAQLPPVDPDPRRRANRGNFHLTRMMETLAEVAGDVDARVEVMARDLSFPYHYVQIAEVLTEAGRPDDALAWAERGLAAFEDTDHHMRGDSRLDDVVLAGWSQHGRMADVVDLVWKRFMEKPTLASYQRLKRWTSEAGEWDEHRPRAMVVLESQAAARAEAVASRPTPINRYSARLPVPTTHDELIAVLAWDGQLDDAWAIALDHGASLPLWLQLAAAMETERPLDAASAYARDVEAQIDRKQTRSYENAVDRVAHIRTLHERAGDPDGFDAYLANLRNRHRQKTKFIRLLDEVGLTVSG
ncbi:hypothetical protein HC251_12935 [Iamia sp. SCSIO 61187]|uniref:DUF6880 family protein n=1 Tax=Iamia sp. SCSIO 61187 TaxID=2722752 RepID=UPI001C627A80|nr:DUF6880 family protein [Iamia sp. SCSIO 61187]QYG93240.1 hypothetical protein HC251_12935 [Iamia sp. SCSIO 61187]